ncbi:MAG: hypothetical protein V4693_10675 [Pseudomonadota bacterium]
MADWIRLEQTPGAGGATVRKLLAQFASPQRIFDAGYRALSGHVPAPLARALSEPAAPAIVLEASIPLPQRGPSKRKGDQRLEAKQSADLVSL